MWTIWKVVVPPLMMIASPSSQSSAASRAMARFCAAFSACEASKDGPETTPKGEADSASAPPRTLRSRFCRARVAMSRRIVASEASVSAANSCTVTTGRACTALSMILCRSRSCIARLPPR
jgi:hypothetical protein